VKRRIARVFGLVGAGCLFLCARSVPAVDLEVTANPDLTFTPARIVVVQGAPVRFANAGGFHNVHADDDSFVCSVNCTTSNGPNSSEWSVVLKFDEVGEIGYYCEEHGGTGGGMRGSIVVVSERVFADGFDPQRTGRGFPSSSKR
jgi:plastocyanin